MTAADPADCVVILMGVYNGAEDLPEQLASFDAQQHRAWRLIASDDGSCDRSTDILRDFATAQAAHGREVEIVSGPQKGFVANFLSLLAQIPDQADWAALSDQDDVWLPERLSRGIATLRAHPETRPALYCSRTWITDQRLDGRRLSPSYNKPPRFRNALVQNIVPGNTILLNKAALRLAREAAQEAALVPDLPAHDWWLYQLIMGVDGAVIRDPEPTLLYRQHDQNQIGANDSWRARATRIAMVFSGRFRVWNSANIAALMRSRERLSPARRAELDRFAEMRQRPLFARLNAFRKLRLYRQTVFGQIAMWVAVLINRL